MKKTLFILLLLPVFLFAELNIEKVNKTLLGILSNKTLNFYNSNDKIKLNKSLNFTSLRDADIILFPKKNNKNKLMIVDSYNALKMNENNIGAIYLRKGRTQIIFVKERLNMNGLKLSKDFSMHLINKWQLNPVALLKNIK